MKDCLRFESPESHDDCIVFDARRKCIIVTVSQEQAIDSYNAQMESTFMILDNDITKLHCWLSKIIIGGEE